MTVSGDRDLSLKRRETPKNATARRNNGWSTQGGDRAHPQHVEEARHSSRDGACRRRPEHAGKGQRAHAEVSKRDIKASRSTPNTRPCELARCRLGCPWARRRSAVGGEPREGDRPEEGRSVRVTSAAGKAPDEASRGKARRPSADSGDAGQPAGGVWTPNRLPEMSCR